MSPQPPLLVRAALAVVRFVGLIVPRVDRANWQREWEGEIRFDARPGHEPLPWSTQMTLFRRSLGALADAAWIRRQFTRDSEVLQDVRGGLRMMRRQPGLYGLAVAVLAIGIGSATAVFSAADAVLLQPVPLADPDRLVAVWQHDTSNAELRRGEVAPGNFLSWRERTTSFEGLAAAEPYSVDYTGGERPEVFFASRVSEGFFDLLRVRPLHGRLFTTTDFVAGAGNHVILGEEVWAARFASDPAVVGRSIPLDGVAFTVIGVVPSLGLDLLEAPNTRGVWIPKVFQEYEKNWRGGGWWAAVGRLAPGVSLERAQADLDVVSTALATEFPGTNRSTRAVVEPIGEHLVAGTRPALTLLLWAVVVVLFVACANVANMMLARAADRDREFAVRGALGAGRARVVRQLLTEGVVVAGFGAIAGVGLAAWLLRLVVALAPEDIPRLDAIGVDWTLALVAAGLGLVAGILSGLAPALQFSRGRGQDALAAGRGSTASRRGRFIRDGLVVAEVALAVALVVGAGLLMRSFSQLISVDPGFRASSVLALQVFAYDRDQRTAVGRLNFFRRTVADLQALPGVVEAGAVSAMPFIGANINISGPVTIDGRPPVREDERPQVNLTVATPEYFPVMNIPVLRGRGLARTDTSETTPVAVVSQAMATRFWRDSSPIGAMVNLTFAGQPRRVEIVGVVGDLRHDALDAPVREELFMPHAQLPFGSMTYVIQTAGDPNALAEPARKAIWAHDPLLTFYDSATVSDLVRRSVAPRRFSLMLVGAFAGSALLLALAGIYGVLSFTTSRQTREFGVRMAMGATSRAVARLVIRRGLLLSATGLVVGLATALLAGRALEAHLFQVSAFDPVTLVAVSVLVLAAGVTACYVPARRAMRVDPLVALRD